MGVFNSLASFARIHLSPFRNIFKVLKKSIFEIKAYFYSSLFMISKHAAFNLCTKFKTCAACVKIINVQTTQNAFISKMLFLLNLENVTKRTKACLDIL